MASTPVRFHPAPPPSTQTAAINPTLADAKSARPNPAPTAPGVSPPTGSAWSSAWRASAWAAVREFSAQATGATIGLLVRGRLAAASPQMIAACGVGAALVMAWMVYRASRLAGAAAGDHGIHEPTTRLAMVAVPTAAVVSATVLAARAGHVVGATTFLTGKLTQRSVRYLLSAGLSQVGPRLQVDHSQGVAITARDRVRLDWHRAIVMVLPTTALCLAQEYGAPTPAANESDLSWEQLLPYVLAVGMVEAARAFAGTLVQASEARAQGWTVKHMPSCGSNRRGPEITCEATLRDAGDAAAMRQVIGVTADLVSVLRGPPLLPLERLILRALRSELKALGEFRAPLVQNGRLALADRAPPTSPRGLEVPNEPWAYTEPVPITALA